MSRTNNKITLTNYQRSALTTAVYPRIGHPAVYPALGLFGEAGEVCNKLKKVFRDNNGVLTEAEAAALADELGDLLWYIAALAHELGFDLDTIAAQNLTKLHDRKRRGTLKGHGDSR